MLDVGHWQRHRAGLCPHVPTLTCPEGWVCGLCRQDLIHAQTCEIVYGYESQDWGRLRGSFTLKEVTSTGHPDRGEELVVSDLWMSQPIPEDVL